MKTYKASVRDWDGHLTVIKSDYESKKDFIEDLRGNGYKVCDYKVKEQELFDWVIYQLERTCEEDEQWALWRFTKIPEDNEEFKAMMDKGLKRYLNMKGYEYMRKMRRRENR